MVFLANLVAAEVPVIENPAEAPVKKVIEMEEVWRIGDNEGEEFIFGVISKVFYDSQGNLLMLDTQQKELLKFSESGEYLQTLCRQGEGPGELSSCYDCGLWDASSIEGLTPSTTPIITRKAMGVNARICAIKMPGIP